MSIYEVDMVMPQFICILISSYNKNIGTGLPNLGSFLAVPPERQNVIPWLQRLRHLHQVHDSKCIGVLIVIWDIDGGPFRSLGSGAHSRCDQGPLEGGLDVGVPICQVQEPVVGPHEVEVPLLETLFGDCRDSAAPHLAQSVRISSFVMTSRFGLRYLPDDLCIGATVPYCYCRVVKVSVNCIICGILAT